MGGLFFCLCFRASISVVLCAFSVYLCVTKKSHREPQRGTELHRVSCCMPRVSTFVLSRIRAFVLSILVLFFNFYPKQNTIFYPTKRLFNYEQISFKPLFVHIVIAIDC